MPDRGKSGPADAERRLRLARVALAALLLGLIAVAIRAADLRVGGHGPLHRDGKLIALALEVVLIVLLIITARLRRRFPPRPDYLPSGMNWALQYALWISVIGLPVIALLNLLHLHPRPARHLKGRGGKIRKLPPAPKPTHLDLVLVELLPLIVLLVLAVVLAVTIWRWRRPARATGYHLAPDEDFSVDLRRAVESGRRALAEIEDARAAIIACYVAMEQSLAEAGTARALAETPDELLARAQSTGLVRGSAAGRLTALFYRARFSARPMQQQSLGAARLALTELADELGGSLRAELAHDAAAGQQGRPASRPESV